MSMDTTLAYKRTPTQFIKDRRRDGHAAARPDVLQGGRAVMENISFERINGSRLGKQTVSA